MDSGQWTVDSGQWTVDSGQWTVDSGQWTVDSGQWTVDSGQWTVDRRQWTVDRTPSPGCVSWPPSSAAPSAALEEAAVSSLMSIFPTFGQGGGADDPRVS